MTLLDVSRIHAYWRRSPPLRGLVGAIASALGVKMEGTVAASSTETPPRSKYMTDVEARRFIAITGGRIDGIGQM